MYRFAPPLTLAPIALLADKNFALTFAPAAAQAARRGDIAKPVTEKGKYVSVDLDCAGALAK